MSNQIEKVVKGITVSIYTNKAYGTCSNGGVSSTHDSLTITSIKGVYNLSVPEIFAPTEKSPETVLIQRPRFNDIIAVPLDILNSGKHYMFGGSFLYSSDSRFIKISKTPIKLFDRVED